MKYFLCSGDGTQREILEELKGSPPFNLTYEGVEGWDYAILGWNKDDEEEGQVNISNLTAPYIEEVIVNI